MRPNDVTPPSFLSPFYRALTLGYYSPVGFHFNLPIGYYSALGFYSAGKSTSQAIKDSQLGTGTGKLKGPQFSKILAPIHLITEGTIGLFMPYF